MPYATAAFNSGIKGDLIEMSDEHLHNIHFR